MSTENLPPRVFTSPALADYYTERLAAGKAELPRIRTLLREAGVALVTINYDGSGDSGSIDSVEYRSDTGKGVESPSLTAARDELAEFFYDLLESRFAGWENDDGAFGEFTWNLVGDLHHHEHQERYTETHLTEVEGL